MAVWTSNESTTAVVDDVAIRPFTSRSHRRGSTSCGGGYGRRGGRTKGRSATGRRAQLAKLPRSSLIGDRR